MRWYCRYGGSCSTENKKQIPEKDKGSDLVGSISAMTAVVELRKHNNKVESPAGSNEEDSVLPEGRGIAAMTADAATKIK